VTLMPEYAQPKSEPKSEPPVKLACSFCGKQLHQVAGLAASSIPPAPGRLLPRATVCTECLDLCDEIFAEEPPGSPQPG